MAEERKVFQKCERCNNWFDPELSQCPYCAPNPPPTRNRTHGKFERERQALKGNGAPIIIASLVIAAIPTAALSDFIWACLYDFSYGAYLNDLNDIGAQEMALVMADELVLIAFLVVWVAIAFVIYRIITNSTAT